MADYETFEHDVLVIGSGVMGRGIAKGFAVDAAIQVLRQRENRPGTFRASIIAL